MTTSSESSLVRTPTCISVEGMVEAMVVQPSPSVPSGGPVSRSLSELRDLSISMASA